MNKIIEVWFKALEYLAITGLLLFLLVAAEKDSLLEDIVGIASLFSLFLTSFYIVDSCFTFNFKDSRKGWCLKIFLLIFTTAILGFILFYVAVILSAPYYLNVMGN